jgi:hypothetical protein
MTLAVGPGTPASCVLPSVPSLGMRQSEARGAGGRAGGGSGEDSSSNVGDEDDIYHDEDSEVDMFMEETMMDVESLESDEEDGAGGETHEQDGSDVGSSAADGEAGENADTARVEAEAEIQGHLAARPVSQETKKDNEEPTRTGRRSRWERRQQSILQALNEDEDIDSSHNDPMNDEEDDQGSDGSHHTPLPSDDDSNSSSNDTDNTNGHASRIDRAERALESLQSHIMRHHRRRQRAREAQLSNPTGTALPSISNDASSSHTCEREVARSMKHGGCINTACWLDCGWRVSTVSHEDAHPYDRYYNTEFITSSSYSSNNYVSSPSRKKRSHYGGLSIPTTESEYPTQLLTSGDDHLVKFWDVAQSMGSTSPLPGGSATLTPFSSPRMPMRASSELVNSWKDHGGGYNSETVDGHRRYFPGIVHPLLTLSTGHHGNIFHACPVPNSPGKVATCAADGYLRLTDIEVHSTSSPTSNQRGRSNSTSSASNVSDASTIVISPEYHNEDGEESMFLFRHSLMCFSHHFINANVGLVCSERGLLHFDLRLPARSQKRGSLIDELRKTCKSCCPWSMGAAEDIGDGDVESAYVFGE